MRVLPLSSAATWRGPLGAPPAPGEAVAARVAGYLEREENVGHHHFITGPDGPRVHLELHAQPRSIYRLWEARRKSLGLIAGWDSARNLTSLWRVGGCRTTQTLRSIFLEPLLEGL